MAKFYKFIFVIGLLLVVGTISLNLYTKYKEINAINNFKMQLESKKNDNKNNASNKNIKLGDEIALIEIKSVNINSVVVSGTNNEQIRHFVGHFENTAMPGENGNFSISGHSSTVYNQVFNDIYKLKIGEQIDITSTNGKFKYKVNEIFETEPTNVSVLNQDNSIKEMTIVTCTPNGKNRIVVKAILDEEI